MSHLPLDILPASCLDPCAQARKDLVSFCLSRMSFIKSTSSRSQSQDRNVQYSTACTSGLHFPGIKMLPTLPSMHMSATNRYALMRPHGFQPCNLYFLRLHDLPQVSRTPSDLRRSLPIDFRPHSTLPTRRSSLRPPAT
jgi:hypothetical protein